MTRLTNSVRDSIIENAIKKCDFAEQENLLKKRRADWVEAVRIDSLGGIAATKNLQKIENRILQLVKDLPGDLLRYRKPFNSYQSIRINVAGESHTYYFDGTQGYRSDCDKIVPRIAIHQPVVLGGSSLHQEHLDISTALEKHYEEVRALRAQIRALLNSVTTVEKLVEVWPEVVELMPVAEAREVKNYPAVQTAELNALLGLPTRKG